MPRFEISSCDIMVRDDMEFRGCSAYHRLIRWMNVRSQALVWLLS